MSVILEAHCLLGCLIYFWSIMLLSSEVGREVGEWIFYSHLLSHFNQTLQSPRNQLVAFNHALGRPWSMVGKRKYWCCVVWRVFFSFGVYVKRFVFLSELILKLDTDLVWDVISTTYALEVTLMVVLGKRDKSSDMKLLMLYFFFHFSHHI